MMGGRSINSDALLKCSKSNKSLKTTEFSLFECVESNARYSVLTITGSRIWAELLSDLVKHWNETNECIPAPCCPATCCTIAYRLPLGSDVDLIVFSR